ncbi:MAG: hypothetical protein HC904_06180 [Blastochloris sp.]|nr:hypothetical protein [Blastochloris sp.]
MNEELVSTLDLGPTVLAALGLPRPAHLQGRVFVGTEREPEPEFVFATRDRFDEHYDGVRAVRSRGYKYIRNLYPHLPRCQWLAYQDKHPAMQSLWKGRREGSLSGEQAWFFEASRPTEEFYDLERDPLELNNVAGSLELAGELERHRQALEEWMRRVGDLWAEPEEQMVRRFWPEGKQPVTASPLVLVYDASSPVGRVFKAGLKLQAPALFQFYSATAGASIGWRYEEDATGAWRLAQGLVELCPGVVRIEAKAIRIGYAESAVQAWEMEVKA